MGKGCVVCGDKEYEVLLDLNCGGFDNSPLYETVTVVVCKKCNHIYNLLTESQVNGIYEYYSNEYSQANIESPNKNGDIPGSFSNDSISRYGDLYLVVEKDIKKDSNVLDVGCAMGGLLSFLSPCCNNLFGIDSTENFVNIAQKKVKGDIKLASAESLPFADDFFDVVFADQVVEHLIDPNIFFREASRVLKGNGVLCISVPDVTHYRDTSFFDFYFFLMREHVHHFCLRSLTEIANKFGFIVEHETLTFPNLISDSGRLPNLTIKFRKIGTVICSDYLIDPFVLKSVKNYIQGSYTRLSESNEEFKKIQKTNELINVYGIGREFHYLWKNTELNKCNVKLYDDTPIKQKMTVSGRPVLSSTDLDLSAKSTIITSFAHINILNRKLRSLGFQGEIL